MGGGKNLSDALREIKCVNISYNDTVTALHRAKHEQVKSERAAFRTMLEAVDARFAERALCLKLEHAKNRAAVEKELRDAKGDMLASGCVMSDDLLRFNNLRDECLQRITALQTAYDEAKTDLAVQHLKEGQAVRQQRDDAVSAILNKYGDLVRAEVLRRDERMMEIISKYCSYDKDSADK